VLGVRIVRNAADECGERDAGADVRPDERGLRDMSDDHDAEHDAEDDAEEEPSDNEV
jgi:hypothetical protein